MTDLGGPNGLGGLGRLLIAAGLLLVLFGGLLLLAPRLPLLRWLGRLPGDLTIERGPVMIVLPIATSIVLSILATILLNLFIRR